MVIFFVNPSMRGQNYERMAEDQRFQQAVDNTIPYVILRAIIAAFIPALIGGLIGSQARIGRIMNRLLLSLIAVLIVPISIGLLWSMYWGQLWGIEPSPVFNEALFFRLTRSGKIIIAIFGCLDDNSNCSSGGWNSIYSCDARA